MEAKTFYGAIPRTFLALVPENPQDSDLSDDDDPVEDPDYLPTPAEESGETSLESMDEEEVASTSSSSQPPSKKKRRRKGENSLKTVSLDELQDTPDPSLPGAKKGRRRLWLREDIETPFHHFQTLFTVEIVAG